MEIFLFLVIDPRDIDVNIHPSKKEIKFRNEKHIQSEIEKVIVESVRGFTSKSLMRSRASNFSSVSNVDDSIRELTELTAETLSPEEISDDCSIDISSFALGSFREKLTNCIDPEKKYKEGQSFQILGVLKNKYIIIINDEGLLIVHKRAAHERILYEKALKQIEEGDAINSQPLLVPITISLMPEDYQAAIDSIELLKGIGLEIGDFGSNSIKVDAIPSVFSGDDSEGFVSSVIGELKESGSSAAARMTLTELAMSLSEKASHYYESRTLEEMNALVSELLNCDMPYVDTRGRSTMTELSMGEIDRKFEGR